ncbi:hypothetical protein EDC96DRAFT_583739 [Choanephora cucurbitarum]|nr:hypothetical protein EDC96DRAFT_583739 [Choanephora cucurbitarum]
MLSLMSKEFENGMSSEDFYRSSFGMTTVEVKIAIACSIDLRKKEDEVARYDYHRKAKTAGMSFWFDSIDCMQVLVDAYGRPVCYHPDPSSKSQLDIALTYFPLVLPKRLDQKPVPLHLQLAETVPITFLLERLKYAFKTRAVVYTTHIIYIETQTWIECVMAYMDLELWCISFSSQHRQEELLKSVDEQLPCSMQEKPSRRSCVSNETKAHIICLVDIRLRVLQELWS